MSTLKNELISLRGQLKYLDNILIDNSAELEEWERKEYAKVKEGCMSDIDRIEKHMHSNKGLFSDCFEGGVLLI